MNWLGRTLTLLILISSLFYFAVALMVGASHTNWKAKAQEMKDEAERWARLKREAEQIQVSKEKLFRTEQVARALKISNLESQIQILREQLANTTQQLQTASQDKENYQSRLREAESRIVKLDTDIQQLSQTNAQYLDRIIEAKNNVVSLTKNKYDLENQLRLLSEREAELADQNAKISKALRIHEIDANDPTGAIEPRMDGLVADIDRQLDLIVVNLGLDDGLRDGHRLEIHREGKYVGSAEVVKAENNRAAARLIRELMQKPPMQGDHVTTAF